MSTPMYDPLYAVPPLNDNQQRMAWPLQARRWARRMVEEALALGVDVLGRVQALPLAGGATSWLRNVLRRATGPLLSAAHILGRSGAWAAATAVLTGHTGRRALVDAGRTIVAALGSLLTRAAALVDTGLRRLGATGSATADWLRSSLAAFLSWAGPVAAAARLFAVLTHPDGPLGRLLAGLSRSYLLHLLLKATVRNGWLRAMAEVLLIPAIVDGRLLAWLRRVLAQARMRAERMQEQADIVANLLDEQVHEQQASTHDPDPVEVELDEPVTTNRAERRAAQRRGKHTQQ